MESSEMRKRQTRRAEAHGTGKENQHESQDFHRWNSDVATPGSQAAPLENLDPNLDSQNTSSPSSKARTSGFAPVGRPLSLPLSLLSTLGLFNHLVQPNKPESSDSPDSSDSSEPSLQATKGLENEPMAEDPKPMTEDPNASVPELSRRRRLNLEYYPPEDQFCQACQTARQSPDYEERILALVRPLHCSGCDLDHTALFFSPSQRNAADSDRTCIGRQGYRTLCPHWKINFEDLERLYSLAKTGAAAEYSVYEETLRCDDPDHKDCPFQDLKIIGRHLGRRSDKLFVQILWSAHPGIDDQSSKMDRCKAEIRRLHRLCPEAFGPNWANTPERLTEFGYPNSGGEPMPMRKVDIRCLFSRAELSYGSNFVREPSDSSGGPSFVPSVAPIEFHNGFFFTSHRGACRDGWVAQMDLDSYDFYLDEDTKHIIWCETKDCATSRELVRCNALRSMADHIYSRRLDPGRFRDRLEKGTRTGLRSTSLGVQ